VRNVADGNDGTVAPEGARDRFGLVLIVVLGLMAFTPVLLESDVGRFGLIVAQSAALVLIYRVSNASRRTVRVLAVLAVVGWVIAGLALVGGLQDRATSGVLYAFILVYIASSPFVIGRRLLQHTLVTPSTVAGALSIYLLVGEFYAVLYPLIGLLTKAPFFAGRTSASAVDYLYFSLVTLATVGYGDFTAAGAVGRMAAATEGLLGQLYLVTIVALVVSNLGHRRREVPEDERMVRRRRE
jgi:hypothetical protein